MLLDVNKFPPFNGMLVKLASRCNLKCTYCYWFRDEEVYKHAPKLTREAEKMFFQRLIEHVQTYRLKKFSIIFHGGEPLLIGKQRFIEMMVLIRTHSKKLECDFACSVTTNAVLVDKEWAQIFAFFEVHVTVSIDGPQAIHDKNRVDLKMRGSYERVINGLNILREENVIPGIIAVCDPESEPDELLQTFVNELNLKSFDILIPDLNHNDTYVSVDSYYRKLFDLWFNTYAPQGVNIKIITALIKGVLGFETHTQSIGYGPISTLVMLTDGRLEPLDVLRIASAERTRTNLSVFKNNLQDIVHDATWQEAYNASLNLAPVCNKCEYHTACGGGHIAHRWSNENKYNNPSVYCNDYKKIFKHIWNVISPGINIPSQGVA